MSSRSSSIAGGGSSRCLLPHLISVLACIELLGVVEDFWSLKAKASRPLNPERMSWEFWVRMRGEDL